MQTVPLERYRGGENCTSKKEQFLFYEVSVHLFGFRSREMQALNSLCTRFCSMGCKKYQDSVSPCYIRKNGVSGEVPYRIKNKTDRCSVCFVMVEHRGLGRATPRKAAWISAPWRVLVPLQVGSTSQKEKARRLTLLKFIFYRNTRSGEHSFDSAAKIAVIFKGLLVDGAGS